MTVRPHFSENRRKPVGAAVALCIVLVIALLAVGCLSQQGSKNGTEHVISHTIPVSQKPIPHLTSDNFWIAVDPIGTVYKNNVTVSGTTNLPEGEILEIHVRTTLVRSMPSGYDFSHESTTAETKVTRINATTRGFSSLMDVTKLNTGNYSVGIYSNSNLSIYSAKVFFNLLPSQSPAISNKTSYIYTKCPSLPPLYVNGSMEPVLIAGNVALVPPGSRTQSNPISYGAIVLFSGDGIDRIFDENGTQIAALYDSNELHLWQVPGGSRIQEAGNITTLYLEEKKILTKIYETKPCAY